MTPRVRHIPGHDRGRFQPENAVRRSAAKGPQGGHQGPETLGTQLSENGG
jgi:hypothetical protein